MVGQYHMMRKQLGREIRVSLVFGSRLIHVSTRRQIEASMAKRYKYDEGTVDSLVMASTSPSFSSDSCVYAAPDGGIDGRTI